MPGSRNRTESVWDYPRPPRVEPLGRQAKAVVDGLVIASSDNAYRVLETSHPPTIYFPPEDVDLSSLQEAPQRSVCEFKGRARYWDIVLESRVIPMAAWSYPEPTPAFVSIAEYLAFYPSRVDACYLDDERVQAQDGDFYGGWITSQITGPFKGPPGTSGW